MRATRILIGVLALGTGFSLLVALPAVAHGKPKAPSPTVLTTAVAAPFNLEVSRGTVLVADGGTATIGQIKANRTVKTLVSGVTGASGIATKGRYTAYTTTVGGPPPAPITASGLTITGPRGYRATGDTFGYETANNPDGSISYGVSNPSQCVVDQLAKLNLPASYPGVVDSHANSVAAYGNRWVVADAGANALLWVSRSGRVSTLAVLPAHPYTFTAANAAALQLDDCIVGVTYNFESVPTDVEVGKGGYLYVTTLPGGPENPALGARGKVFKVNPRTGRATVVAAGLLGATNLAISGGKIYVTELFAGRISQIKNGRVSEYLSLPGALAVEAGPGKTLYAATGITTATSSVVKIKTTGKAWQHHRR